MRSSTTLLACAWLAAIAECINLIRRDESRPSVISMPIQRRQVDNILERERLRKRQTVQATLDNLETLYFANASLGTPEQNLRLHIDTGSSDLWVNSPDSTLCRSRRNPCGDAGTYAANDSSTYEFVNSVFNITYADGSGASGDYVKDTFRMAGTDVPGLQFGVGYRSASYEGILGIGYVANEVQASRLGETYSNLPQRMLEQKLIPTNAFSLWLNDLDASTGSILFGGVDTEKYQGTLSTLPIIKSRGVYSEFIVSMTGMGFDGQEGSLFSNRPTGVLLDSGSTLSYLPDTIAEAIYNKYNAQYDPNQGGAFVDCDLANQDGTIDFTFTSPTIRVPLNELVLEAAISRGRPVCILGIAPSGGSISVLGDTFLRSAYVVYDLTNNEISIAQTNFNATKSNVMEISSNGAVPNAKEVPGATSTLDVNSSGGRIGRPTITPISAASSVRMPAKLAMVAAGVGLLLTI